MTAVYIIITIISSIAAGYIIGYFAGVSNIKGHIEVVRKGDYISLGKMKLDLNVSELVSNRYVVLQLVQVIEDDTEEKE